MRQKVNLAAYASLDENSGGAVPELSEILDISEHGIAIQTSLPLNLNSTLSIGLDLPETKSYIQTTGRVVWSEPVGKAGICFPEMSKASSRRLKEWLRVNATASSNRQASAATQLERTALKKSLSDSLSADYDSTEESGIENFNARNIESYKAAVKSDSAEVGIARKSGSSSIGDYSSTLAALRSVKQQVQSPGMDIDKVLELAAERARGLTQATGAAIGLRWPPDDSVPDDEMRCCASDGTDAPDLGARLKVGTGFSGECVRTGKLLRCDDSEFDPRVDRNSCRALGIRSMVALPIKKRESIIGILEVFSPQPNAFGDSDNVVLQSLAELVASAVEREERRASQGANLATEVPTAIDLNSTRDETAQGGYFSTTDIPAASVFSNVEFKLRSWVDRVDDRSRKIIFIAAAALLGIFFLALIVAAVRNRQQDLARAPIQQATTQAAPISKPPIAPATNTLAGLRKLADHGDATAQFALAARYATGEGVKQDYAEALHWFSKAAEQGHVTSQATLGAYYWAGRGVPQDLSKAYFWALLAQAGGDQGSKYRLPVLAARMSHGQILTAQQQAEAWLKKSHDGPSATAAKKTSALAKSANSGSKAVKSFDSDQTEANAQAGGNGRVIDKGVETSRAEMPSLSDLKVESNPDVLAGIVTSNPPLPTVTSPETVRVSQGYAQALLLKKVPPIYPRGAIQIRLQGSVQLQATISKDGTVSNLRTLAGDPLLARAAADAVKQWEYKPYYLNGQPVEMQTLIVVNFKLP
ncbi:MAG: hypothetical protein NVS1B11_04640 [Terriglobales bacterium]